MHRTTRRTLLKATPAAAALPFLPSLTSRSFGQAGSYDRFLFIAWSHGVWAPAWQPRVDGFRSVGEGVQTASLAGASLGMYMADSLADFRSKMTIVRGVGLTNAREHQQAVLTGSGRDTRENTSVSPISVDNVLADHIYAAPPSVPVLRLSIGRPNGTHSFRDHRSIAAVSSDVAFAQLFSDGFPSGSEAPAGPSAEEQALRRRLRVVEGSLAQYRRLMPRLGGEDRRRVEQTIERYDALARSLELRLDGGGAVAPASACRAFSVTGSDERAVRAREHVELFTQAFACGVSRVGYWKLGSSHSDTDGAHQAASDNNRAGTGLYSSLMRENCRFIADLLRSLDGVMEANGKTLLENTLVVVCSDMSTSVIGSHPGMDAPFLLAGGLGGRIRMGEFIDYADYDHLLARKDDHDWYAGPPHNELLIAIMRAAGLGPSEWGGPSFGHYPCEDGASCDADGDNPVNTYRRYYRDVYARRTRPGTELPYLRV
ncbi:MAG: DUF1552 domain-containing protein [Myxococcota bacterium]